MIYQLSANIRLVQYQTRAYHNIMKLENLAQTSISQTDFNTTVVRKRL